MNDAPKNIRILHLFADTNFFLQCRSIIELPWSDLGDFDEIRLIVCRPVIREIDNQKYRGNDRVGKRARSTYKLFRDIIATGKSHKIVNDGKPKVILTLEASLLPSRELKDHLDYTRPDDEIIGCMHEFRQNHRDSYVRLFTHDGGPMILAQSLNLDYVPISNDWLLAPENSKSERQLAQLKKRVTELQQVEPRVRLKCVDQNGEEIKSINIKYLVYDKLSDYEVATLVQKLKNRFPQAKDFGPLARQVRQSIGVVSRAFGLRDIYTPASPDVIQSYEDNEYPVWIEECENTFARLHQILQRTQELKCLLFVANNFGNRPAKDVLVEIEARGAVRVNALFEDEDNDDSEDLKGELRLPTPPLPPRGRWDTVTSTIGNLATGLREFERTFPSESLYNAMDIDPDMFLSGEPSTPRRDPNAFYYKSSPPNDPVQSFRLECEQWRHGTGDEYFEVAVSCDTMEGKNYGAVECSLHAENISTPIKLVVPVEVTVKRVRVMQVAEKLIRDL